MNMQKILKIIKKIVFLPPIPVLIIAIPSFTLVIWVLVNENANLFVSYLAYILSAYALIITVAGSARIVRAIREAFLTNSLVNKFLNISVVDRYRTETMFRAEISLYPGLLINLLYAGLKLFSGIYYRSVWFGTLAVYYSLLAMMRFFLLHHVRTRRVDRENRLEELKKGRLCGMILLVLGWALAGMIILVVRKNDGFSYPGMMIYLMALYTFYSVITAAVNVIRFRKYGSPVMSAAKVINLTVALVSLFSLETAMLTQFGEEKDVIFRQQMTGITGTAVIMLVLGMAVYMVIHSTTEMNR